MFRVMVRDSMSPVAKEILEASGKIDVVIDNDKSTNEPERLSEIIGEFDGLAIRSGTRVTSEVLKRAKRLKVVGRAGVGVDNIDLQAAIQYGVVVMNAPGGNSITTAEHAISMMMSLARNIPQATSSLKAGKWEKKQLTGIEISGKTLGIIGLGQIGRIVANRALGLKMRVIASDPFISQDAAKEIDVKLVSFDELLSRSDIVTLHVPNLKETKNMINSDTISRMRAGVRIVNCSRGEVVNLDDLFDALENGQVAGAAIDVFPQEPPDPSLRILQHPNVVLSPHLGASTGEAQVNVAQMIAEQMTSFLLDGVITNAVNFPSVSMEEMGRLRPYLNLAEKMGSLMGQLRKAPHDIAIGYSGDVTNLSIKPITNALLKGLLGVFTDNPINYVNARAVAKAKGISVKETITHEESAFSSLIKLGVKKSDNELNEIWGTIYENQYPRLVRIGDIYLDAIPDGSMIVIQNVDRPGVIGNIGTVLGNHNVNIARFQLGRRDDRAVCLVNIDSVAEAVVLEELKKLPNILSVKQAQLD